MHISEINIYPVKSLRGLSLAQARVDKRGLQYDRRCMLTDENDRFLTQREFPKMATISAYLDVDELIFSAAGFEDITIRLEPDPADLRQVSVWSSTCLAEVYGGAVNEWFSDVLEVRCRLYYMPDDTRRAINPLFDTGDDIVSFADGYPVMVLGEASLEDLNSRLARILPMNRFRPNLVVSGSPPYAEDGWKRVRIGEAIFRATKPCARCVITTVDRERGHFAGNQPLRMLATFRKAKTVMPDNYESLGMGGNDVLFGQNLVPENTGDIIRAGDAVEILE